MDLLSDSYFILFLIVTIGLIIGNIQIKGLSLDVSAIIFVALLFGHYGFTLPNDYQTIGLVLFIFTIGMQAGPGFFESFKKEGRQLATLATILIGTAALVTFVVIFFLKIDKNIAIGLLTGSLTSTPGLAAAIENTGSPLASIGYGVGYPFGVIGVILFIRLLPRFYGSSIDDAEKAYNERITENYPELITRNYIVENDNAFNRTLEELRIREMTGAVVSRILQNKVAVPPRKNMKLQKGDLIKAIGTQEALDKIELLIGSETDQKIPLDTKYDFVNLVVTNKNTVNKTLRQLNLFSNYGATITRIRRSGINITPTPNFKLQFGDKVIVAISKSNIDSVTKVFGNSQKDLSHTDFLPIALGVILGVVIGKINLTLGSFAVSPGLTGGVLLVALILSKIGKTGPIVWSMSGAANQLLREFGLILFLATVGTSAGSQIVETFQKYGIELFLWGSLITLLPMIVTALFAKSLYKMNLLTLMGSLSGSMTSTPGLAAADSMSDTNAHSIAYATVYPVALVLLIVVVQLLSIFL